MSKTTITLQFYLQGELVAAGNAYIPKSQAMNIQELHLQSRKIEIPAAPQSIKKSQQNDEQDNQMIDQDDQQQIDQVQLAANQQENEVQPQIQVQGDVDADLDVDIEQQDDQDLDISQQSQSVSVINTKYKTKRQKGDFDDFVELPDKKPRKRKGPEVDDIVRKQEKQQKRKQYLKKQLQAQQKATLDKILNQTGRKLRLRQQKQTKDQIKRQNRQFKNLGDVPKIITKINQKGTLIMIHKTKLFPSQGLPDIKMKELCSVCHMENGKYRVKNKSGFVCSVPCYQKIIMTST